MNSLALNSFVGPDITEIDPRICGFCGCKIDRHEQIDTPEGPEFYCFEMSPDEATLEDLERRAELLRQEYVAALVLRWELADDRDRWRRTGEPRPPSDRSTTPKPAYRTPQSTIDAFKHVISLNNADYLERWLAEHPRDAAHLFKIWKGKQC